MRHCRPTASLHYLNHPGHRDATRLSAAGRTHHPSNTSHKTHTHTHQVCAPTALVRRDAAGTDKPPAGHTLPYHDRLLVRQAPTAEPLRAIAAGGGAVREMARGARPGVTAAALAVKHDGLWAAVRVRRRVRERVFFVAVVAEHGTLAPPADLNVALAQRVGVGAIVYATAGAGDEVGIGPRGVPRPVARRAEPGEFAGTRAAWTLREAVGAVGRGEAKDGHEERCARTAMGGRLCAVVVAHEPQLSTLVVRAGGAGADLGPMGAQDGLAVPVGLTGQFRQRVGAGCGLLDEPGTPIHVFHAAPDVTHGATDNGRKDIVLCDVCDACVT